MYTPNLPLDRYVAVDGSGRVYPVLELRPAHDNMVLVIIKHGMPSAFCHVDRTTGRNNERLVDKWCLLDVYTMPAEEDG